MNAWLKNVRIGFFLAVRQIRRANWWTTSLIIFVMVLTFLNLVVVSGILVGLIQGSIESYHTQYTGDVIISSPLTKNYIENTPNVLAIIRTLPQVAHVSVRFKEGSVLEANYQTKRQSDKADTAAGQLIGIDPSAEDSVTGLSSHIMEGSYLRPGDYDQVLLGYFMLKQYVTIDSPDFTALHGVHLGSKIRITVHGVTREVWVKGILRSKVDNVRRAIFMVAPEAQDLMGRADGNAAEIAIKLVPGADPTAVSQALKLRGIEDYARVQTYADAQPQFLKDIIATFDTLGTAFGSIALVVASITIFIVVFINALTRRKFIGILKGIGIDGHVIEIAYVFQSVFYAVVGSAIGLGIVYGILVPAFIAHPINFPFSDGILVAPVPQTLRRVALLVVTTLIAGFIPAWMIVRKNTLDSILGRN